MSYLTGFWFFAVLSAVFLEWLWFPLAAPLSAYEIFWQRMPAISWGMVFHTLIVTACICKFCKLNDVSMLLSLLGLVVLFYLPLIAMIDQPRWILDYSLQSREREAFTNFVQLHYVQNVNMEPTFNSIKSVDSVINQLDIVSNMLGLGWYLAVLANFMIISQLLPVRKEIYWLSSLLIILTLMPAVIEMLNKKQAEQLKQQGHQLLIQLQADTAIQKYKKAFHIAPTLFNAPQSLVKVSDAYAIATQHQHPFSKVSEAWVMIKQHRLLNNQTGKIKEYIQARMLLQEAVENFIPQTGLEIAVNNLCSRLINHLLMQEALALYAQGKYQTAIARLKHRHLGNSYVLPEFYQAHFYTRHQDPQSAIALLQALVQRVDHPAIKADIYCSMGDAYNTMGQMEDARSAYVRCAKLDNIKNYRVIKALTGF